MQKQLDIMDYISTQTMIHGDCLEEMRKMDDNSIDFIVTDSPYGISFMSKAWDQQIPPIEYWQEMLRICKPGSMMACAGLPRMYHRLACVVEDAGWQIRDCIMHIFGSGFPKSLNIGKSIDKDNGKKRNAKNFCKYFDDLCKKLNISNKEIDDYLGLSSNAFHFRAWNTKEPRFPRKELYYKLKIWLNISDEFDKMIEEAEREIIGIEIRKKSPNGIVSCGRESEIFERKITLPKLELSKTFDGYGTALKPAYEPWLICMKPIDGTFAQNAEKWGVAGINIDSSRIFPVTSQRLSDIISEKGESEWGLEKYLCNSCVNLVENKTKQEILEIMESFVTKNVELITIEKVKKHLIDTNILDIGCLNILFQEGQKKVQSASLFLNMLKYGKKQTVKNLTDMLFTILTMILGTIDSKICNLCHVQNILAIIKKESSKNLIQLKSDELNTIGEQEKDIIRTKKNDVNNCEKNTQNARWPSNLILSEESAEQLDQMTGVLKSGQLKPHKNKKIHEGWGFKEERNYESPSNSGGASRFFYCAKSSSAERNKGLEGKSNTHCTVKPLSLMKYILKLLAPPGNPICLDPFMGSGTTGLACKELGINFIGIEKELEYFEIAQQRIKNG